jgi:hypothetical protein
MKIDLLSGLHFVGKELNPNTKVVLLAYPHLISDKYFLLSDDDGKI